MSSLHEKYLKACKLLAYFNAYHIQDIQMNYITFGKGEKPLILIQGLSTRNIKGAAFSVAYMYRMFARDYKVYLFDRRENISDSITVRNLATDIAMAMDTLKITNADIFGVSQGGMIAQYLAIDRPDLVNQLVLAVTLSKNNETVERSWTLLFPLSVIKPIQFGME